MKKQVKMSALKGGPVRHGQLPDGFADRVKRFKAVLAEVETDSLESTLEGFKRDRDPETELRTWERMAATYQWAVIGTPGLTGPQKKDVFAVILGLSMGMTDFSGLKHLSQEKAAAIIEYFWR